MRPRVMRRRVRIAALAFAVLGALFGGAIAGTVTAPDSGQAVVIENRR